MAGHGHRCEHEHDHEDSPELGIQYSLFTKIDNFNLECLNESVENSGKDVFRPWEDRLKFDKYVESDCDAELLFNIPFTGNVKLKGLIVIGSNDDSHPAKMKLYKNRPHMTFDDVSVKADQEFDMERDSTGTLEYATRVVAFSSVTHLSIYFPKNFSSDDSEPTRIYYIGLRGEFTEQKHDGIVIFQYEAAANPADHKVDQANSVSSFIK